MVYKMSKLLSFFKYATSGYKTKRESGTAPFIADGACANSTRGVNFLQRDF
jgi:hypothetical protein